MGKKEIDNSIKSYREILSGIKGGSFKPFYLLMGEEPYYSDVIIDEIARNALTEDERGFNQLILYGSDVTATQVVESARRYPMLASRQVVIVKEAQMMDRLDELEFYFRQPMPTTLLVVSLTNKSLDKRTTLYKSALSNGVVFESFSLRDDMIFSWIESYIKSKGYSISPEAALLMGEYCGTELRKLVLELDKLLTNLPDTRKKIDTIEIEENIGISREYNVFELTKAISFRDSVKIFKIVKHFGASPRQFPLVVTISALFMHFSRLLKYHAIHANGAKPSREEIASYLGIMPYFMPEYDHAARNYPLIKCMEAISLIRRYDSMGKSSQRGEAEDGDILLELVYKISH
ncbi:MAG: DNA polymerase III subunit delta [Bacteroidetes bacterium GWF2_41_61]|jgi:DNA polymerase-3 subunit delta|nr:MAG: DNA polymerase III subunit delta [Bacteroidetes bacterium GWF2_41_61]PKP05880.1 MAG: DNA polymerase III subunit delta [Bacteroidetes bacterium HGW-Bacteroidetes-5]HBG25054.1 DNA polymerase III subunit delta [Rikenellaceae bacterium]